MRANIAPVASRHQHGVPASGTNTLPRSWTAFLSLPSPLGAMVFPAVFFVAYRFAMGLTPAMPSPLWFPDSVLLCALLLSPRKTWWFYLLCTFPLRVFTSVPSGLPVWFLIACFVNDSCKALFSALLVQRFCGRRLRFQTLQQFLCYSMIAVIFIPLLSSIAGGASRYALGGGFFASMRGWFLGDALANLVLTPMILCFSDAARQILGAPAKRYWEAILLVSCISLSGYLAFIDYYTGAPFLLYLPVPFLLWSAVRFGPFAAACSLSGISALSIVAIFHGQGPFVEPQSSSSVLSLQLFLIVISFSLLALATVVRQQKAGEAALRASEEKLHQLNARLIHAQETERKRISQELYDDVAQRVAALSIGLSTLTQSSGNMEGLAAESSRLRRRAAEIVTDISRLSQQLRPPSLEQVGLPVALRTLCEQENEPVANVVYSQFGDAPTLPWEAAVSLYRVAQESLKNALVHSGATLISVCLSSEHGTPELSIRDNGMGFELDSAAARGTGLAAMAERMRSIGGRLLINTMPGGGTEVVALISAEGCYFREQTGPWYRRLQRAFPAASGSSK